MMSTDFLNEVTMDVLSRVKELEKKFPVIITMGMVTVGLNYVRVIYQKARTGENRTGT